MKDSTYIFDYPIAYYVVYPEARQSDTMDFMRQNNDWMRFEPIGTTPIEPLKSYLSQSVDTRHEYNGTFKAVQGCSTGVLAVFFLVWVGRRLL